MYLVVSARQRREIERACRLKEAHVEAPSEEGATIRWVELLAVLGVTSVVSVLLPASWRGAARGLSASAPLRVRSSRE